MRLVTDTIEFATREMPLWNSISISGYHIREAGSTAAQELAFTLASGFEYVRWALDRGLAIDEFAPRLSFFFNAHSDFFEEIAKYRAARRIWAREMRDSFGATNPRSWWMRFHAQTAGVSLTDVQPEVNLVRVALQALSAVLGGTQSLHTNAMDEALALPSEKAARLAVRTQQVLLHETGAANSVDPLGGSYMVESLTSDIEREAYEYFARIEDLGGMIPALEGGFPSARSRRRPTASTASSPTASARSSASPTTRWTSRSRSRSSSSTPRARRATSSGSSASAPRATPRPRATRWRSSPRRAAIRRKT